MFNDMRDSTVAVTGGTGSFGSTMVRFLLNSRVREIRVFSRDELKQEIMRTKLQDDRLKFYIGDVRDYDSVKGAIKGSDLVFHAAALKQVPTCEFFPNEAVKTNVNGSANVIEASYEFEVGKVICLSTDKAVYPVNVMGSTKSIMEKIAQSYARENAEAKTRIAVTRYGNVMMSRGSVVPLFLNQIKSNAPLTITNPSMTRFVMSLSEAVSLVQYAFLNARTGDLIVKKAKSCTIEVLAKAVCKIQGIDFDNHHEIIGTRHGEKLYETLLTNQELSRSIDAGDFFVVPLDERGIDYDPYFSQGFTGEKLPRDYSSNNVRNMNVDEVASIISLLPEYLEYTKGEEF